MFKAPRLSDEELYFRNLYKAGQRRVADAKRKKREKIQKYNDVTFNQLELDLVRNPDQKKWLLDRLRSKY